MLDILLSFLALLIGMILIDWGSDYSAASLSAVARRLGTTRIAVGLVLVSAIVSLPEVLVVIYTKFAGYTNIGLGVIIGSIAANIGLMAGLIAMFRPLKTSSISIFRDGIFALFVAIIVLVLGFDMEISRGDGIVLILMFIPYLLNVWGQERLRKETEKAEELHEVELELRAIGLTFGKMKKGIFSFIIGMGILLVGSYVFSESLIGLARHSNLSELVIGLVFGAIGTTIPNFASAFKARFEEYEGVAISETLGANVFTLLVTLGVMGILGVVEIGRNWLIFGLPVVILMSALLLIFMGSKNTISRKEGSILFFIYLLFIAIQLLIN